MRQTLLEQAQDWDQALRSGDPSVRAQFVAWIRRSPQHLQAYLQHLSFETEMQGVDRGKALDLDAFLAQSSSNVVPLLSATPLPPQSRPRKQFITTPRYAAALLGIVAAVATGLLLWRHSGPQPRATDYITAVGEQRRMALPDGSTIELNTQTHIRVLYGERARHVELVSGEAFFSVRHDERSPFRVQVGDNLVEDVGTQFSVYLRSDRSTTVSVLDGRVRLSTAASGGQHSRDSKAGHDTGARPQLQLEVGQAVRLDADGHVLARTAVNLAEAASWRQHRMWFENATLKEIAAEFNRYNTRPIYIIDDPALAKKRYTATWDPYDPGSFISYLQNDPGLAVEAVQNATIIRGKRAQVE